MDNKKLRVARKKIDLVDRNILYGQIFLQPTRTAEFIVLDFTVQPTGATFPEQTKNGENLCHQVKKQ